MYLAVERQEKEKKRRQVSPIGRRLRELRTAQGLSYRQLAQRAGVSDAHISDLENGKTGNPTQETILKLAKGLRVSADELRVEDGGRLAETPAPYAPEDQESAEDGDIDLSGVQVNLKTLKALDAEGFDAVRKIVQSMLREAEEIRRAEKRARRKSKDADRGGSADT